uniref:Uncharacterized protein n=1 Tax=Cuerna arida TaxID=1464854 RepID=A0A1B6EIK4_9HEMI
MGSHSGVWAFNDELRKMESSQWLDYRRISNGILHIRLTRRAYRRQDAAIHVASDELVLGQCNVAQFLDRMSHCTRRLGLRRVDQEKDDWILLSCYPHLTTRHHLSLLFDLCFV